MKYDHRHRFYWMDSKLQWFVRLMDWHTLINKHSVYADSIFTSLHFQLYLLWLSWHKMLSEIEKVCKPLIDRWIK